MDLERRFDILPYVNHNLGPDTFKAMYEQLIKDNTLMQVFYDGSVRSFEDFEDFMNMEENKFFLPCVDGMISGIVWVNGFRQRTGFIHQVMFSNVWGKTSIKLGRFVIKHILELKNKNGEYILDLIQGLTPDDNLLAVKYLRKCGMQVLGELPNAITKYDGSVVGGIVSYCTMKEVTQWAEKAADPHLQLQ